MGCGGACFCKVCENCRVNPAAQSQDDKIRKEIAEKLQKLPKIAKTELEGLKQKILATAVHPHSLMMVCSLRAILLSQEGQHARAIQEIKEVYAYAIMAL